ncbi:MAG: glycosyltransferase family 2 protein [Bacteroidales bacterium]
MKIPEYFTKKNFVPKIEEKSLENLNICVVLPSYNEPNLGNSLETLEKCTLPIGSVEVIVVVNHPEGSPPNIISQSEESVKIVEDFNLRHKNDSKLRFYFVRAFNLPKKNAGVGLARQIGMDEAAYRLFSANNPDGIITCFDADATCESNYLVELENLWKNQPRTTACSIRYAHPYNGNNFSEKIYKGIAAYELHLRYYNQASRFIGFPFSYHTIGSSMACSAITYIKFGGMNRHQAGEDFYFLQKIIPHGNFQELNSTSIYPSPRPSTRVPFGTGRAMLKYLENTEDGICTYNLDSFTDLIPFFDLVDQLWSMNDSQVAERLEILPIAIRQFLISNNATKEISRVKQNTSNQKSFRKRFFLWFDAFALLKYLNYANENHYKRQLVENETIKLGKLLHLSINNNPTTFELLDIYREKDLELWIPKF